MPSAVGGGHIGRPLAELARIAGYDVQVEARV